MFIIILVTLILTFLKSLHLTYLFQIKEYRLDRFMSMMRERGFLRTLYSFYIRFPALSLRNSLIVFLILIFELGLFLSVFEFPEIYILLNILLPMAPFMALLFVILTIYLTAIPVFFYRKIIIIRAYFKVRNSKAIFIGITGSYGKTSVKEFIYSLLSTQYQTGKTDANMNTDVGVAQAILKNLQNNTEFFVVEFGAYRKGEIKNAAFYIPLKYVVLTGLGNQHLDLYGGRAQLIAEETSPMHKVPGIGTVYVNENVPKRNDLLKPINSHKVIYGFEPNSTINARILEINSTYIKAVIRYKNTHFVVKTQLFGTHNIVNLLPAIAIALDLRVPKEKIISSIQNIKPIQGKLSLHTGFKKATILSDLSNSNVEGFIAAIKVLQKFPHKNKLIITQGIIELGVEKRSSYERILHELYKTDILIFTTDSLFEDIDSKERVKTFNDVVSLQQSLLPLLNKHTVVLIEGKFPKNIVKKIYK